ncbi:MAG: UDP-N-acetylmuramoyl-L-alanyl-D-glutamate--2,6-diaminopimelate ligase [Methylobacteriaceae bacterium]|nr:UDP-N-acetylmuramoyl-L-alanyl-D-glutamate--2,6-diaminopimelate ligase [Methylobacteriaceae bacterium]
MNAALTLGEALAGEADVPPALAATRIGAVTADSRAAGPGAAFFAIPGARADGAQFAASALAKGAAVVVAERALDVAPLVVAPNVRRALSRAASRLYPRQPATIAAVTGTSGKTSVAAFLRQIWLHTGHAAASLGTIGVVAPSGAIYGSLTTPDPASLHATLDRLAGEGVTHLAMEASSHGLDQHRLDGVRLAAGAFTNLSRDHLDYHPDLAAYLEAKLRLFRELLAPGQPAVIEADGDHAADVIAACRTRGLSVFTVGARGEGLKLLAAQREGFSTLLTIAHAGRERAVRLPLAGDFQASNALVAAGLALVTGAPADDVFAALERLAGAPGRLERVGERAGGIVIVDYAHKPDALDKALAALRPYARRRLIVAFGCGGDRDPGKRPMMGAIAARLADIVIVTDDNPRSEDPAAIRAQILAAAPGAREIGDRRAAIAAGVAMLEEGDVFLVAGKGHEEGQIVGATTLPFSDHEAVATALKDAAA